MVGEHLVAAGFEMTTVELDAGEPIPDLEPFDALVVMGGPMDVWEQEQLPWLVEEKAAIRRWVATGAPLSGRLPGPPAAGRRPRADGSPQMKSPEVGVLDVELLPGRLRRPALLGDVSRHACRPCSGTSAEVVGPPPGQPSWPSNAPIALQAFRVGHWAGVQFHIEADVPTSFEKWADGARVRAHAVGSLGQPGTAHGSARVPVSARRWCGRSTSQRLGRGPDCRRNSTGTSRPARRPRDQRERADQPTPRVEAIDGGRCLVGRHGSTPWRPWSTPRARSARRCCRRPPPCGPSNGAGASSTPSSGGVPTTRPRRPAGAGTHPPSSMPRAAGRIRSVDDTALFFAEFTEPLCGSPPASSSTGRTGRAAGFEARVGWEFEYIVPRRRSAGAGHPENRCWSALTMASAGRVLAGLTELLGAGAVPVDHVCAELGPGCFEIALAPGGPGALGRLGRRWPSSTPRRFYAREGRQATFMAQLGPQFPGLGGHPSLSLRSTVDGAPAPVRRARRAVQGRRGTPSPASSRCCPSSSPWPPPTPTPTAASDPATGPRPRPPGAWTTTAAHCGWCPTIPGVGPPGAAYPRRGHRARTTASPCSSGPPSGASRSASNRRRRCGTRPTAARDTDAVALPARSRRGGGTFRGQRDGPRLFGAAFVEH